MRLLVAPPAHYGWLARRAGITVGPGLQAIEVVDGAGAIKGMVGFDGWTPNTVSLHVALDTPVAGRKLLKAAFGIAFLQFKKGVVLAQVLSSNAAALRVDAHLGFRELTRVRDGWQPGIDLVLLEMRREDCRFIPRQAQREAA